MKKYFLLFLYVAFATVLQAQDESKYLAGAIQTVDGKVKFSTRFTTSALSQEEMFDALLSWSQKRFLTNEKDQGRVLYSNPEKGQIVNQGSEYMVFSQKALSLDRTRINYRVTFLITPSECTMEITGINYIYGQNDERLTAEEMITDEAALNKSKTKLIYGNKKFRIKTIDLVEELGNEVGQLLSGLSVQTAANRQNTLVVRPTPIQQTGDTDEMPGYTRIAPEKIPGNIVKLLSQDWMLITVRDDEKTNMMTASWGGLGYLYNKPVAFCFIHPARYTYQLMEKEDTYTLSFYTETYRDILDYCGSHSGKDEDKVKATGLTPLDTPTGNRAFSEAWMVIECKKLLSQPFTPDALKDDALKEKWGGQPMHKMYIGEILNVWVK